MVEPPATMWALRFSQHGGPEVLEVAELPLPRPGPGEILLRVRAASVNPVDVGLVAMPLPFVEDLRLPAVPGWDVTGTVVMPDPEASVNATSNAFTVADDVFEFRLTSPRRWPRSRTSAACGTPISS